MAIFEDACIVTRVVPSGKWKFLACQPEVSSKKAMTSVVPHKTASHTDFSRPRADSGFVSGYRVSDTASSSTSAPLEGQSAASLLQCRSQKGDRALPRI